MKHDNQRESTLAQTRMLLRRINARAIKGLGQHFLTDRSVLDKIISAADLSPSDMVVEVGPGLGILTEELVKRARSVIAVEVDSRLVSSLQKRLYKIPQLTVINADVLQLNLRDLIESQRNYKVVANLPYYIASAVLRHFLEASLKPSLMVVMVQKEVGQSIVAAPGELSLLGISVQLYGRPAIVDYVPAESFYPQPKVDSAIVRIDVYPEPAIKVADITGFFEVVKAGFSAPRKQIRNSLALGLQLTTTKVLELLEQAGIAPRCRPETLSIEEWDRIYSAFVSRDKG